MKYLIICADDFGYSKIFNKKILEYMKEGFITSTGVMVEWLDSSQEDQINELNEFGRKNPGTVGLHIDFISTNFTDEIKRQYKLFLETFDFKPAHIDIHKHTYLKNGFPFIMKYCSKNNIPCRNHGIKGPKTITTAEPFFDTMYVDFDKILNWAKSLADNKIYGIFFHPGDYDPDSKSSYNKERETDNKNLVKLCSMLESLDIKPISYDVFS